MKFGLKTSFVVITLAAIATFIGTCFIEREYPVSIVLPASATPVTDQLASAFSKTDTLKFRSFEGRWMGVDSDVEIEITPDGNAKITMYGNAVNQYTGTYTARSFNGKPDHLGFESLQLPYDFPTLAVYSDKSGLLLLPARSSAGFAYRDSAKSRQDEYDVLNWTFRIFSEQQQSETSDNKTFLKH